MRPTLLRISIPAVAVALLWALPSRAQTASVRVLEGVHIDRAGDRWDLVISFTVPVQVLRHAPESRGDEVTIQLAELGLGGVRPPRESLSVSRDAPVPVASVTWEETGIGGPSLDVRFRRTLDFEVLQGRDLRSVVVRVATAPAPARPQAAQPEAPAPAARDERAEKLVEEGRRALTQGEFARAALIFQGVLDRPESDQTPTALELLGLARERVGQLAHAVASYEEYLRRYPDGEGATRVRQRLDALSRRRSVARRARRRARAPGASTASAASTSATAARRRSSTASATRSSTPRSTRTSMPARACARPARSTARSSRAATATSS
jgi:hypothetical protein